MSAPGESTFRQEVVVLDPGLKDHRTHHHVINRNLAGHPAVQARGLRVLAHRRAGTTEFSYPVVPTFRRGIYEDSPALNAAAFDTIVTDHSHDLSRCLAGPAPTAIVVHTATAAFLQALGATLASGSPCVSVAVIQLMFHPLGLAAGEVDAQASMARYAEAFRLLRAAERRSGVRMHLSTSCLEFARVFETLGAGDVDVHPYALLAEAERPAWTSHRSAIHTPPGSARRRVFLFGGDPKFDKGLAWVAAALPDLLAEHHDVDFLVHLGDNRFGDPRLEQLRRQVIETSVRWPHLRVMEGHLAPPIWDSMIESADFLLVPYDPRAYRWKTSGVFWEMLLKRRTGAVMAVTKGTWMERASRDEKLDVAAVEFGNTAAVSGLLRRMIDTPAGTAPRERPPVACLASGNDEYITARLSESHR